MSGGKKVILSGCIGIKKFIFGVAMADYDANATPNMNFFHLKSVSLPYARTRAIARQNTLIFFCSPLDLLYL